MKQQGYIEENKQHTATTSCTSTEMMATKLTFCQTTEERYSVCLSETVAQGVLNYWAGHI